MKDSALDLVGRLSALARLELSPAEAQEVAPHFRRILEAFRALERADLEGDEGSVSAAPRSSRLRADEPEPSLEREQLLGNAPEPLEGFYGIPQVIPSAPNRDRTGR